MKSRFIYIIFAIMSVLLVNPFITDTKKRQLAPDELIADTLYGSDANHQAAAAADVQLTAPVHKGNSANTSQLTGFSFDESGYVTSCPTGQSPDYVRYKKKTERFSAVFNQECCQSCPLMGQCKLKPGKNKFLLHYSKKQCRTAVRRAAEQSVCFTEVYRWRAGVEATMSEFNRRTGVKNLRVRGGPAVRFASTMKAAGLNILRAGAVRKARRKASRAGFGITSFIYAIYTAVKERILRPVGRLGSVFLNNHHLAESEMYMAA